MNTWPARRCSGDCNQGGRECTTPQACELPDVESMKHAWKTQRRLIGCAIVVTIVLSLLALAR